MEKKDKKKKAVAAKGKVGVGGKGGAKRNNRNPNGPRGNNANNVRRGGLQNRGIVKNIKANLPLTKKRRLQQQKQQKQQSQNVAVGFVTKRFNNKKKNKKNNASVVSNGLVRARSNTAINRLKNNGNVNNNLANARGAFATRRVTAAKFGLTRSRSRTNLVAPTTKRFFSNNKGTLKRTNSMPNLRDPTSVHNRLGYQSPAQVAYRNRVKRAKQLLLQRQNQRMQTPNDYRVSVFSFIFINTS